MIKQPSDFQIKVNKLPDQSAPTPDLVQTKEVAKPINAKLARQNSLQNRRDDFNHDQRLADKYIEILKCAQNYDMEKHQRKLRRMEEKRQNEELRQRLAYQPPKKRYPSPKFGLNKDQGEQQQNMFTQEFVDELSKYHMSDIVKLKRWFDKMVKNDKLKSFTDEQMYLYFKVDLKKIRQRIILSEDRNTFGDDNTNEHDAMEFFQAASHYLQSHIYLLQNEKDQNQDSPMSQREQPTQEQNFGLAEKLTSKMSSSSFKLNIGTQGNNQASQVQISPFLVNQQSRQVQKDSIRKIKTGKRFVHVNILRDPLSQTLTSTAISPMVTKIARTDKKREVKNPKPLKPEKSSLNLDFVKANFFIEDPENSRERTREFAALTIIDDIQETLEGDTTKKAATRDAKGGRHNFQMTPLGNTASKESFGTLDKSGTHDITMEKSESDNQGEQTVDDDSVKELQSLVHKSFLKNQTADQLNVELLKDEALIKMLDENLPIKRIFALLKQQYLMQFVKKEMRPDILIQNPNLKQRQLQRRIVIENQKYREKQIQLQSKQGNSLASTQTNPFSWRSSANASFHNDQHEQKDPKVPLHELIETGNVFNKPFQTYKQKQVITTQRSSVENKTKQSNEPSYIQSIIDSPSVSLANKYQNNFKQDDFYNEQKIQKNFNTINLNQEEMVNHLQPPKLPFMKLKKTQVNFNNKQIEAQVPNNQGDPSVTQFSGGYNFQQDLQKLQNTTFQLSNFNTDELSFESFKNLKQTRNNFNNANHLSYQTNKINDFNINFSHTNGSINFPGFGSTNYPNQQQSPQSKMSDTFIKQEQRNLKKQRNRYQSVIKNKQIVSPSQINNSIMSKLPSVMIINEAMQIQQNQSPEPIIEKQSMQRQKPRLVERSRHQGGNTMMKGKIRTTTQISREQLDQIEQDQGFDQTFSNGQQLPNLTLKKTSYQFGSPQGGSKNLRKKMANSTMRYGKEMLSTREQELIKKQEFEDKVDQFSQFWNQKQQITQSLVTQNAKSQNRQIFAAHRNSHF